MTLILKTNEGGAWVLPQIEELQRHGSTVVVVLPKGDGRLRRALDQRSVDLVESPFDFTFRPRLATILGLFRMRRLLKSLKADVFFYHLFASALAVRICTLGLRVPRVHMVAGPLYLDSRLIRFMERFLCRLDSVLIAGSDHTRDRYAALRMPPGRLLSIPYGVDCERFRPGIVAPRTITQTTETEFVVIMVAYVYAPKSRVYAGVGIKGHDVLLEAWRDFAKDHDDVRLIFVGGGFDNAGERHRQQLMRRFDVARCASITWLDSVTDARPYYAAATLSVSPSLSENHGAALEASAMGVPSIVTDAGALPETVVDGHSGWIVPANNAKALTDTLASVYESWLRPGRLAKFGDAARAIAVERFSSRESSRRVAQCLVLAAGDRGDWR